MIKKSDTIDTFTYQADTISQGFEAQRINLRFW